MHAKASLFLVAVLAMSSTSSALAQSRAESPFAATAASASAVAPKAVAPATAASSAATVPGNITAVPATAASAAQVASQSQKAPGALLAGAPTIAQLSILQQAALQADARKKAAELYAAPEAASAPSPTVVRRIDPFGGAAPKPAPALLRVAAIVGKAGAESVEIRDAAGRVAVYKSGMTVGDWRLLEVRTDAVLLRKVDEPSKVEAPRRHRAKAKAEKPTGPVVRLVPLGGEFPAVAS